MGSADVMRWYKMHIGDYLSHTAHLDEIEDLAYRRMLDTYYQREKPFPDDLEQIARLIRLRSHTDRIAVVLEEFFEKRGDEWHHKRADEEIAATQEKSEKARQSAAASHKSRRANSERKADAKRKNSDRVATQDPRPKTQDPNNSEVIEHHFARWWSIYPTKKSKKKAHDKFVRILAAKPIVERKAFTDRLIDDVKKRISIGQMGFDKLHPTTYLNGERWDDDYTGGSDETSRYGEGRRTGQERRADIGGAALDPTLDI